MHARKIVGRDDELAFLKKLLDEAIQGKGRIIFLSGEAGIGKTRLVEELASYAREMGVLYMHGRCLYREGADPYLPFLDALRELSSKRKETDWRGTDLPLTIATGIELGVKETAPMGLSVMEGGPEDWIEERDRRSVDIAEQLRRIDLGRERDRMFEAISSIIMGIARTRPLLFFIDELHWADMATLQLLTHVVRSIRSSRVLIVAAYRPEELAVIDGKPHPLTQAIARIAREGVSANLALRRLGLRETRHLLSILLGRPDLPEGFVEAIFRRTGGNPYFVEEVVKSLVEQRVINPGDATWPERLDLSSVSIPSTVRAVIAQRVSGLESSAARALESASVLGDDFTFEELRALSDMDEGELKEALGRLKEAHLVSEGASSGEGIYRFTHTLLREVVYENLSRTRRRTLHRKAAAAIEKLYADRIDEHIYAMAYHYAGAGDLPRGARYFAEAGHKALQSYALDEAARYYSSALEALEKLEPTPENIRLEEEVLVSLGNVHYIIGEWNRALEEFAEVIKLGEESGSDSCRALSHLRMGEIQEKRSDWAQAAENLQKSLEIYTALGDPTGLASTHLALGTMHWRQGEYQKALEEGERCLSILGDGGEKYLRAMAMSLLGNIYTNMGEALKARECYEKGLALALEIGDPLEMARAYNDLGLTEMRAGHYDAALELFQKSVEAAKKSGNIRQVGYTLASLGECFARAGDLETAMDHLDSSIAIFEKLDEKVMIASIMMRRGLIFRNAEEWEMARKCFLESTRVIEELNLPFTLGEHLLEFGITCAMQGDKREARRLITRALHTFEAIGAKKNIEKAQAELRRLQESEREE
ncbi:MAG: tetratricopeptide repeat protein [Thermoplasmata archaeon]